MKIRKFKHKKTGHIFEQDGSYYNRPKHEHIPAWLVEGSNDWEEIIESTKVEKDYKILSLTIHDSRLSDMTGYGNEYIEALLKDRLNKIHSVKRILDGEIFTIGDNCEYGIITNMFITKEGYCMTGTRTSPYSCNILYLKHKKQPLFTTEDGVDIFEGDTCVSIFKSNYQYSGIHNWAKKEWFTKTSLDINKLYFSNKDVSEEYILMNKPCLSINDITYLQYSVSQELIKLVKQKLNK